MTLPFKLTYRHAVWALLPVMALLNVLLIKQNLQMRKEIDRHKPSVLQKGDRVEPFSAPTLRNQIIGVDYTGTGATRVLVFFTPSCPYCSEQFPYWREILRKADASRFQLIGVVSESDDRTKVEGYLRSFGCESLQTAVVPKEVGKNYKLSMTPTTLLIDNGGTVQEVWTGKWQTDDIAAASAIFGFQFSKH